MALRDGDAGELLAPTVIVAMRAGEIELTLAPLEDAPSRGNEGCEPGVAGLDGHPARLARDIDAEREELLALEGERGRTLMLGAADVYAFFYVDRRAALGVESRIACGHSLHGTGRLVMAVGTRAPCCPCLRAPGYLTIEHPQHAGIGRIFVLHRLRIGAHLLIGRPALVDRNVAGENWKCGAEERDDDNCSDWDESAPLPRREAGPMERPHRSFHDDLGLPCRREAVVAGPFELECATFSGHGREGDERIGGDGGIKLRAEYLLTIICRNETGDDVTRDCHARLGVAEAGLHGM